MDYTGLKGSRVGASRGQFMLEDHGAGMGERAWYCSGMEVVRFDDPLQCPQGRQIANLITYLQLRFEI
jgi:hypothetical protein